MFYSKIRIGLILSAVIFLIGIARPITAQTPGENSAPVTRTTAVAVSDPCENPASADVQKLCQSLEKVLTDLDAADAQIKARDAQLANKDETIKLQEQRFQKMLQILYDFANVEQKDKKNWWKKTKKVLGEIAKTIVDPDTLRLILLAITVIEARD